MAKTKAVAYVRMSTDKQDTSPEQQRIEIKKYAKKHGYAINDWYQDDAVSGDNTEKRIDFQRMIADATMGGFDAILCWDQDRFGRFDSIEFNYWAHQLREHDVVLVTVTEGLIDWSDMAGRVTSNVKQEGKHQFLSDLSRGVSRRLYQKAEQGQWAAGAIPFGYVLGEDGKLHLGDPDDVATVREMFRRYAAGASLRELADWLIAKGIRRGKKAEREYKWTPTTISEMLRNDAYLGVAAYGKSSSSKYRQRNPKRKRIEHDRESWIIRDDAHPAIIDRELFDAVGAALKSNRRNVGRKGARGEFALRGMVRCAKCGGPMNGWNDRGNRTYLCGTYTKSNRECDRYFVEEKDLLRSILRELRTQVFDTILGRPQRMQIMRAMKEQLTTAKAKSVIDEGHLAKVQGQLDQAKRRLVEVPADMIQHVSDRIRELEDQEAVLKDRLGKMSQPVEAQMGVIEKRIDAAMAWLPQLESLVDTDYDPKQVRLMLAEFVRRVTVKVKREPLGNGTKHRNIMTGGEIVFSLSEFPVSLFGELSGSEASTLQISESGNTVISWGSMANAA